MINNVTIEKLTKNNFSPVSLDGFVRIQEVTEVYRIRDGKYKLVTQPFTDDWTAKRKREKAEMILSDGYTSYGAFRDGRVIGLIMLSKELNAGRLIVDSFHVSREYRHCGIGRELFACAVKEGIARGASQLYISACSSKETVAFYKAMGCRLAECVIPEMAEDEPFDLQLVFDIPEE